MARQQNGTNDLGRSGRNLAGKKVERLKIKKIFLGFYLFVLLLFC